MICKHFLFLKILINWNINKNFNSHCKYQLRMKGKEIKGKLLIIIVDNLFRTFFKFRGYTWTPYWGSTNPVPP